jgi:predicted XRE-type DNA-binding protein
LIFDSETGPLTNQWLVLMTDLSDYMKLFRQNGYSDDQAATCIVRFQLIKTLKDEIERRNWTQAEAAKAISVAQPRIAEVMGLRIDKFSVDLLIKYLHRLGKQVSLQVK